MSDIETTLRRFSRGEIDKPTFIRLMYDRHHAALFDYARHLARTNIRKIEIEDGRVIMTSRDRGVRIACPPGDHRSVPIEILNFLDYETDESAMIESLVADGDWFLDVGANIGWYAINIATARPTARVHAFEPIPKTFEQLQANVALNALPNIVTHNFGLYHEARELDFYYHPEGSGNASSANVSDRADAEVVRCEVRTLDDFIVASGARADFIKCDVEGGEFFVFEGGRKTIARDHPIVVAEILRKWSAKFRYDPNRIFELFHEYGYRCFTAQGPWLVDFGTMDESTVATNFFFLHGDKHQDAIRRYRRS